MYILKTPATRAGIFEEISVLNLFRFFGDFGLFGLTNLGFRFQAFGANLDGFAINRFFLKIDAKFSFGSDVGMTAGIAGFRTAAAHLAESRHIRL